MYRLHLCLGNAKCGSGKLIESFEMSNKIKGGKEWI